MNIDHLRAFYNVAKYRSFTAAAKALYLTQPAITVQIQSLERNLGVRLFNRIRKKVSLTHEGESLLSYAEKVFSLIEEMKIFFEDIKGLYQGKIIICATAVMGIYFLPSVITRFNKLYPGIEIYNTIGNSQEVTNMVLEGHVEIGVGGAIFDSHPQLAKTFLHTEKLVPIISPNNPLSKRSSLSIEELRAIPFIGREKGTRTGVLIEEWLTQKGLRNNILIELGHIEAVKKAVQNGPWISILPEVAVKQEIETELLKSVNIPDMDISIEYYLIHLKGRKFSKALTAFIDVLIKTLR